jgi:hypothetical protein
MGSIKVPWSFFDEHPILRRLNVNPNKSTWIDATLMELWKTAIKEMMWTIPNSTRHAIFHRALQRFHIPYHIYQTIIDTFVESQVPVVVKFKHTLIKLDLWDRYLEHFNITSTEFALHTVLNFPHQTLLYGPLINANVHLLPPGSPYLPCSHQLMPPKCFKGWTVTHISCHDGHVRTGQSDHQTTHETDELAPSVSSFGPPSDGMSLLGAEFEIACHRQTRTLRFRDVIKVYRTTQPVDNAFLPTSFYLPRNCLSMLYLICFGQNNQVLYSRRELEEVLRMRYFARMDVGSGGNICLLESAGGFFKGDIELYLNSLNYPCQLVEM